MPTLKYGSQFLAFALVILHFLMFQLPQLTRLADRVADSNGASKKGKSIAASDSSTRIPVSAPTTIGSPGHCNYVTCTGERVFSNEDFMSNHQPCEITDSVGKNTP